MPLDYGALCISIWLIDVILVKCATPEARALQTVVLVAATVLDILSDLMIVSIPVCLLWNVKMPLRSKLALGCILSLSVLMVIIAIVRMAAAPPSEVIEASWSVFWLHTEACVAVIVVSVSAFRAFFVAEKASKKQAQAALQECEKRLRRKVAPPTLGLPSMLDNKGLHSSCFGSDTATQNDSAPSPVCDGSSASQSFDDDKGASHKDVELQVNPAFEYGQNR